MKVFIRAALIRACHTMAQYALALLGTATLLGEVNWMMVLSGTLMAGIISLLKSFVIGMPEAERIDRKREDDDK